MPELSDALKNKVADHLLGGPDYARPATVYLALYTSGPNGSGGGTEVSGGSYARAAVTNNSTNFPGATGGSKSNGTAITFPTATGSWGTVTHVGIFDAATGGNFLRYATLTTAKVISNTDTPSFAAGSLTFVLN